MFNENHLGFELRTENYLVFFGNKKSSLEMIKEYYNDFEFLNIKQTHSDICLKANSLNNLTEADAHFTSEKCKALVIRTADCLPILIYSPVNKSILSIHAGWRGVENEITKKSLSQLGWDKFLEIYIGPHIAKKSFEVDEEVKVKLLKNIDGDLNRFFEFNNNKFYVDLQLIVESQIKNVSENSKIHQINQDTFNNNLFNSYRTDKTIQRNISFITLL